MTSSSVAAFIPSVKRGIDCGCGLLKCRAGVRAFTRQLLDILDMLIQRIDEVGRHRVPEELIPVWKGPFDEKPGGIQQRCIAASAHGGKSFVESRNSSSNQARRLNNGSKMRAQFIC